MLRAASCHRPSAFSPAPRQQLCRYGGSRVQLISPSRRQQLFVRQRRRLEAPAAVAQAVAGGQAVALVPAPDHTLVQCLLGSASGAAATLPADAASVEVDVVGTAQHLGIAMDWRLSFSSDGSFLEQLSSQQMSCSCGHEAAGQAAVLASAGAAAPSPPSSSSSSSTPSSRTPSSRDVSRSHATTTANGSSSSTSSSSSSYFSAAGTCWGTDDGGCPRHMHLDDQEAMLLATWVRTGLWVLPGIAAQLEFAEVPPPPADAAAAAAAAAGGSDEEGDEADNSSRTNANASASASGASKQQQVEAAAAAAGGTGWVEIWLRGGGRATARVEVCTASWRPVSMRLQLAGEEELWRFSDPQQWRPGAWLAGNAVQTTAGDTDGIVNRYQAHSVALQPASAQLHAGGAGGVDAPPSRFAQPPTPDLPADSTFLADVPEEVPAWHTVSGHSLVQPLINGRPVGHFILDTGASGFVLDPAAAEGLGLEGFGELQVTSMVGKIRSRFSRADSFQLGPLRMDRPLFMELPCSGLVTGAPDGGRVVGIVGYDVLRRAVLHMPPRPRRAAHRTVPAEVDSPAAAVAAARMSRNGALQYTLRLEHPGGSTAGAAAAGAAGSSAAAAAIAAVRRPLLPVTEAGGSSSSSSSSNVPAQALASSSAAVAASSSAARSSSSSGAAAALKGFSGSTSTARKVSSSSSGSSGSSSSSSGSDTSTRLRRVEAPAPDGVRWLPLVMVAGLPHAELQLTTADGLTHTGLFMLDSGAGGLELIINAGAAMQLRLGQGPAGARSLTQIKGIGDNGGGSTRLSAQRCQLAQVLLGPASFRPVQALFHTAGGGGLNLSHHTSGIVCGGLLGRCHLTFDYARMRLAVVQSV